MRVTNTRPLNPAGIDFVPFGKILVRSECYIAIPLLARDKYARRNRENQHGFLSITKITFITSSTSPVYYRPCFARVHIAKY